MWLAPQDLYMEVLKGDYIIINENLGKIVDDAYHSTLELQTHAKEM
jgi:hypothetical protein